MSNHEFKFPIGDGHAVHGSEADILALQAMLAARREEGRGIGRSESQAEIKRLRNGIKSAQVELENDMVPSDLMAEYLGSLLDPGPEARGETPLFEIGA